MGCDGVLSMAVEMRFLSIVCQSPLLRSLDTVRFWQGAVSVSLERLVLYPAPEFRAPGLGAVRVASCGKDGAIMVEM